MNKPAVSQAVMRRMRRALERDGLRFGGYRAKPDGSIEAIVADDAQPLTPDGGAQQPSDPLDAELAQWATKHGYG